MLVRGLLYFFILASSPVITQHALAAIIDEGDELYLQTSLYTAHFKPSEDHNNHQRLLNAELVKASGWIFGLALFHNSFDQPSQYLYAGYHWTLPRTRELAYFKLTGGLLHGYKGEHEDAVPFNDLGVSPAILPSLGVKYKRLQSELTLFGTAGIMWSVGVNFPLGRQAPSRSSP
jgi:hypothetical protein